MAPGFFVTLCLCVGLCAFLAELADGDRHVKLSVLFTPQERQNRRKRIVAAVLTAVSAIALVIGSYVLYRRMKVQSLRRAVELERAERLGGQKGGESGDPIYRAKLPEFYGGKGTYSDGRQGDPQQLQKRVSQNIRCTGDSSDGGWTKKTSDDKDDRQHNARPSPYADGSSDHVDFGPRRDRFGDGAGATLADLTTTETFASAVYEKGDSYSRWRRESRGNSFNNLERSSPKPWHAPPLDEGAGDTPLFPLPFATREAMGKRRNKLFSAG